MSYRVGVLAFIHESNTFSKLQTTLADFYATQYFVGDEIPANYHDTGSEIGGCMDVAAAKNWNLDYILAAHAQPGGPVSETARRHISNECVRALKNGGPYDGLFVALHGAMVTGSNQDGDCQFLREIRAVVGKEIPIAITLDLHANIASELSDLADIAVSFRTYPHVDLRETGRKACALLHQTMGGKILPKLSIARPPMLMGCDDGRTMDDGPMCRLLESASREMETPGILNVAINAGFTDADVWASGPSVLVNWDKNVARCEQAEDVAKRICHEIWDCRDVWNGPIPLNECMGNLSATPANSGQIVIADYADNPGAGGYSDCTALICAMLDAGLSNAAAGALLDPDAVFELAQAGVGANVTLDIGGKTDPKVGGGPIRVTGKVMAVSEGNFHFEGPMFVGLPASTGASVCFRVAGIDIMLVSQRMQMLDKNIFRVVGIEPDNMSFLAVKSQNHFKGAFGPGAQQIIITDAGGLCSPDVTTRDYVRLRRPVFPLDNIDE